MDLEPAQKEDLIAFLARADALGQSADANRPHVLVSVIPEGGVGAIAGPFADLWEALAYAPEWQASMNEGEDEATGLTIVEAHVLYDPSDQGAS